jgi:hypothetical protein
VDCATIIFEFQNKGKIIGRGPRRAVASTAASLLVEKLHCFHVHLLGPIMPHFGLSCQPASRFSIGIEDEFLFHLLTNDH